MKKSFNLFGAISLLVAWVWGGATLAAPAQVKSQAKANAHVSITEFNSWTSRFSNANANGKTQLIEEGVALAKNRRATLAEAIKSAPEKVLESAVPASVRKQLPPEVTAEM